MRKSVAFIGAAILALSLCACGEKISEGTIYQKDFEPAHTVTWTQFIMAGKVLVPIVHLNPVPDSWYFFIYQDHGDERETARWQVSESQYNSYEVGDYFVAFQEAGS